MSAIQRRIGKVPCLILVFLCISSFWYSCSFGVVQDSFTSLPFSEVVRDGTVPSVLAGLLCTGKKEPSGAITGKVFSADKSTQVNLFGILVAESVEFVYMPGAPRLHLQYERKIFERMARVIFQVDLGSPARVQVSVTQLGAPSADWSTQVQQYLSRFPAHPDLPKEIPLEKFKIVPVFVLSDQTMVHVMEQVGQAENLLQDRVCQFSADSAGSLMFMLVGISTFLNSEHKTVVSQNAATGDLDLIVFQSLGSWSLSSGLPTMFSQDIPAFNGAMPNLAPRTRLKALLGAVSWNRVQTILSLREDAQAGLKSGIVFRTERPVSAESVKQLLLSQNTTSQLLSTLMQETGTETMVVSTELHIPLHDISASQMVVRTDTQPLKMAVRFKGLDGIERINTLPVARIEFLLRPIDLHLAGKVELHNERAILATFELVDDTSKVGFIGSGPGGIDLGQPLQAILGDLVYQSLGSGFLIKDWNLEFRYYWESINTALAGLLLTSPLLAVIGLGTPQTIGLGGEVELGLKENPLRATCRLRGGLDSASWLLELSYGQRTGLIPLVLFIAECMSKTVLHKSDIDLSGIQRFFEQVHPIVVDGFYLRAVPNTKLVGGKTLPYGFAGNVQLRSFGQEFGADLLLNEKGLQALALIQPFSWGPFRIYPARTESAVSQAIKADFASLKTYGITPVNTASAATDRVALQLMVNDKGIGIGSNIGVSFAGIFDGSMAAFVSDKHFDVRGKLRLSWTDALRSVGIEPGAFELLVNMSPRDNNVHPFSLLQRDMDPSKVMVEVEFSQSFNRAIQKMIQDALAGGSNQFSALMQTIGNDFLRQTQEADLQRLRSDRDRICGDTHAIPVPLIGTQRVVKDPIGCAAATAQVAFAEGKNLVLDKIPQLGDIARQGLAMVTNAGLFVIDGGKLAVGSLTNLVVVQRIFWKGTLDEFSQGILKNITIEATLLGRPVQFSDITLNLFQPVRDTISFVSKLPSRIIDNLSQVPGFGFLERTEYRDRVQQIEDEAAREAEKRYQEWLKEEQNRSQTQQNTGDQQKTGDSDNKVIEIPEDWTWSDEQWDAL